MANARILCRHCGEYTDHVPIQSVILYCADTSDESFYNSRCPQCGGISHHSVKTVANHADMVKWFMTPGNVPMILAAEVPPEVAEICEIDNRCLPAVNMDDVLDLVLSIRIHDELKHDLRDELDFDYAASALA